MSRDEYKTSTPLCVMKVYLVSTGNMLQFAYLLFLLFIYKGGRGCCYNGCTAGKMDYKFFMKRMKLLFYAKSSNAVFTLGKNMFSLITNEICFTLKSVHIR